MAAQADAQQATDGPPFREGALVPLVCARSQAVDGAAAAVTGPRRGALHCDGAGEGSDSDSISHHNSVWDGTDVVEKELNQGALCA